MAFNRRQGSGLIRKIVIEWTNNLRSLLSIQIFKLRPLQLIYYCRIVKLVDQLRAILLIGT